MSFQQLCIITDAKHGEIIGDLLTGLGALAVMFSDDADQPIYEPDLENIQLWKRTQVTAFFASDVNVQKILRQIKKHVSAEFLLAAHIKILKDKNWVVETQKNFHPLKFGKKLWIVPSWETPPQKNAVVVTLDPGVAFGTGTHPTTALCLVWLEANVKTTDCIIDYGCGSGILAIAAIKLGAQSVWAIDHDPQAIEATEKNAVQNQITDDQLTATMPDCLPPWQADILIANILAEPIIQHAVKFAFLVKSKGNIVLSGILREQTELIKQTFEAYCDKITVKTLKEWVLITGIRR